MKKIAFFGVIGVVLLVGGCMLAPEYTRPDAPVSDAWPTGAAYANPSAVETADSVTNLTWREFFPDLQMQHVIATALTNNLDLRLAALNVERARALYGIQRAEIYPVVTVTGGGSKQRSSSDFTAPGESRTTKQFNANVGMIAWEIDFFGRIRSLKERALQEYLATEEARRSAQIAMVAGVARVYLTLAADRENLQLAQVTLETQQGAYDLIRRQYDLGVSTELDLRRSQTQVDTAKRNMAIYTQQVAQDQNALNLLAGSPLPEDLLPENFTGVIPPRELSPGLSSETLLNRPDILAAENRLKGAYATIGAARAAFFPRISLTTAFGVASDELSGLFGAGSDTWSFAPKISMPIFDARTWAAYRVSKADREIALTQYEKSIQTAFREVADSLAVRGTVDQQIAAQQSIVDSSQKIYDLSNELYTQGVSGYLGVLDAHRTLYTAQQGLILLHLTRQINQVRLFAVLGGGGDNVETAQE